MSGRTVGPGAGLRSGLLVGLLVVALGVGGCARQASGDDLSGLPLVIRGDVGKMAECPEHAAGDLAFYLRPMSTLPGLDNTHVLVETRDGVILDRDLRWSARPPDLLEATIAEAMRCSSRVNLRRSLLELPVDYKISGRLLEFAVKDEEVRYFRLRFRLDIWGPRYDKWIIGRLFERNIPLEDESPEALEEALRQALASSGHEVRDWLDVLGRNWRTSGF